MSKKSLFSLLLVMIMACCAVFTAGAEDFLPFGDNSAFSVSVGVEINPDGLNKVLEASGQNIGASVPPEALNTVISIINSASVKATIAGKAGQAELLLKDTPIINLAGQVGDDGITVVTDLLPSYAVFISNEELEAMMQQLQSSIASSGISMNFNPEDIQYLIEAAMTNLSPAIEKVMTSFGPEESGSWTFDGSEFTARQPLNMTAKEVAVTMLEAVNGFVSDQKVQSILGGFGIKPEQLDLTSSLQDIQNADESNMPELSVYKYANNNGETYLTLELAQNGQGFTLEGGMVGGRVVGHMNILPDMAKMDLTISENGEFTLYTAMNGKAMGNAPFSLLEITVTGKSAGNAYNVDVVYAIDQTDFMTLKMAFEQGGEITASFDKAGKKVLSLQDIMAIAQGSDTATLDAIKGELTTVAMTLVGKLASIMPNEITQLMTLVQQVNR